jgi:ubiquinone/menaquinone biosynthesis C-methylase UbiE
MPGRRAESLKKHMEIYEKVYASVYQKYPSLHDHALTVYYNVPAEVRTAQLEVRRLFFDKLYRRFFQGRDEFKVLDCGCGEGLVIERINKVCSSSPEFFGNDISQTLLKQASNRLRGERFYPVKCPAEDLPFSDENFEIVLSSHAIEHMHDPMLAMKEMVRVLKTGGILILVAPREEWRDPIWGFPLLWPLVSLGIRALSSRREKIKRDLEDRYADGVDRSLDPPDRAMRDRDLERMLGQAGLEVLSRRIVSADFDWILYYRLNRSLLKVLRRVADYLNHLPGYWMHEHVYTARKVR